MLSLIQVSESFSDSDMVTPRKVSSKSEIDMPEVASMVPFMVPVADSDDSDLDFWNREAKAGDEGSEAADEPPPKKVTCVLTKLSVLYFSKTNLISQLLCVHVCVKLVNGDFIGC